VRVTLSTFRTTRLIAFATDHISAIHVLKKESKARFGLTMSPELLRRIDEKRGLIPRATYIEHCMKQYFELENLKSAEIKFYEEIQAMLRDLMTEEKTGKILSGLSLISSRIAEKREAMITHAEAKTNNKQV
jgi:hypothetical protein